MRSSARPTVSSSRDSTSPPTTASAGPRRRCRARWSAARLSTDRTRATFRNRSSTRRLRSIPPTRPARPSYSAASESTARSTPAPTGLRSRRTAERIAISTRSRSIPPARTAFTLATTADYIASTSALSRWTPLNSSISASQAQSVGPHPTNSNVVSGGISGQRHRALQRRAAAGVELDGGRQPRRRIRAVRHRQSAVRLSYVRDDLGRAVGLALERRRRHVHFGRVQRGAADRDGDGGR